MTSIFGGYSVGVQMITKLELDRHLMLDDGDSVSLVFTTSQKGAGRIFYEGL